MLTCGAWGKVLMRRHALFVWLWLLSPPVFSLLSLQLCTQVLAKLLFIMWGFCRQEAIAAVEAPKPWGEWEISERMMYPYMCVLGPRDVLIAVFTSFCWSHYVWLCTAVYTKSMRQVYMQPGSCFYFVHFVTLCLLPTYWVFLHWIPKRLDFWRYSKKDRDRKKERWRLKSYFVLASLSWWE